ncbi:MAG: hypothetical protein IPH26_16040 [Sterolibacteriaceae bacterium]|uniref:Uncharacterized protein n=1 Tax=Candidatus Methylophosphatis roskildensis TaxID=2899263 RepID=A0A9D7E580_9PROT|nr:hypothetical protein [Candidatus Methylophosphatis roskildensis]
MMKKANCLVAPQDSFLARTGHPSVLAIPGKAGRLAKNERMGIFVATSRIINHRSRTPFTHDECDNGIAGCAASNGGIGICWHF